MVPVEIALVSSGSQVIEQADGRKETNEDEDGE